MIDLLEWLIDLEEMFTSLLKDMTKDTSEQSDEEIQRARDVARGLELPGPLPAFPCFHQLGSSLNPAHLGFYGDLITEARSITNSIFQSFSLLKRMGAGAENAKL